MLQGLFAHAVCHHVREIACSSHRGDVEYPSAVALGHVGAGQLSGDQRGRDIDVHYQLEPLGGEVEIAGKGYSRVVDEHVNSAELRGSGFYHALNVVKARKITADRQALPARRSDSFGGFVHRARQLETVIISGPSSTSHRCAQRAERNSSRLANPPASPGDDCDFASEIHDLTFLYSECLIRSRFQSKPKKGTEPVQITIWCPIRSMPLTVP